MLCPNRRRVRRLARSGICGLLDRHRVLCGSALDAATFRALLSDERAAMVFTDPPYNVPIDGHASGLGAIQPSALPDGLGRDGWSRITSFLSEAFRNLVAFRVDGALHFICMDWRHVEELWRPAEPPMTS